MRSDRLFSREGCGEPVIGSPGVNVVDGEHFGCEAGGFDVENDASGVRAGVPGCEA